MGRPKGTKNGIRKMSICNCNICHCNFQVEPYRFKSAKYCSKICKVIASKEYLKKSTIEKQCERCGNIFQIKPTNKNENNRKFCSKKCAYDTVIRGRFIKENSGRWKERLKKKCQYCGSEFLVQQNNKKDIKRKFCSFECSLKNFKDTSIEIKIENVLKKYTNYVKQFKFNKFYIDFAIPEKKIFIECDGIYWHSKPEAIKRDDIKNKLAISFGWNLLRFSDIDINNDIKSCEQKIKEVLCLV